MNAKEATKAIFEAPQIPGHPILIIGDYKKLNSIILNKCIIIKVDSEEEK